MTLERRTDDVDRVAARIVEDSAIANALDTARETIAAAVDTSIAAGRLRQSAARWQQLTSHDRLRCLLTLAAVALAGHLAIAPMLPPQGRPNALLAAGVLALVMLAVAAETSRRRP